MIRLLLVAFAAIFTLTACESITGGVTPGQSVYRIKRADTAEIQFRVLDSINAVRLSAGLNKLQMDSKLTAAAATHARDMSVQNRPWHFGSDGSSPLDRIARVGYGGKLIGENISETYENEAETLAAWLKQDNTREVIMSPAARNLGIAWFQEPSGKIWWALVIAG